MVTYVVFSFNSSTHRVPVRELSPYLWDTELLDSLVAFPYGKGIVIVPFVEVDVVENNFTVIKKAGGKSWNDPAGLQFYLTCSPTGILST